MYFPTLNLNLFPLALIGFPDYYLPLNGFHIYSGKKNKYEPVKLNGYRGQFTLNKKKCFLHNLIDKARSHIHFERETADFSQDQKEVFIKNILVENVLPIKETYQETLMNGIEKRGWIIGTIFPSGLYFYQNKPKIYLTEESYLKQMEIFARQNPSYTYVGLIFDRTATGSGLVWT